jgi:hypothetical protein
MNTSYPDNREAQRHAFKHRFLAEWARLNPQFRDQDMNPWQSFLAGLHQGAYGYFAPLRILWWLCARSWRHGETGDTRKISH